MKQKIIIILKSSKFFYRFYYFLGIIGISILKLFVRPDDHLILFNSFGGKKYDDSPKAIYLKMIENPKFQDWKLIWAFHSPENFKIPKGEKIKTDTLKYYIIALKAKCWITNSGIERGLSFKGKNTIYLNTWHGTPIKKMGTDIDISNQSFKSLGKNMTDIMNAQSDFEVEVFSRVFGINANKFIRCGLPRNDRLAQYCNTDKINTRNKLGIAEDAKVILYAPTFREYDRDIHNNVICEFPFDINNWTNILGNEYVMLFRAHYEVSKKIALPKESSYIKDVSMYESLNDLIIASDLLISDYSSIIFDYSITNKPIFLFTYDYKKYENERGMYFDIRNYFTYAETENELLYKIMKCNTTEETQKTINFRYKFVQYYGNAINETVNYLYAQINLRQINK